MRRAPRHPTQLVVAAFAALAALGAGLLALPWSVSSGVPHPGIVRCFFTATSAVTVTGLANVAPSGWSPFGEAVLLVLVQVGGFGIMTVGAVLALLTSQRLGFRLRMAAQAEIGALTPGEVRSLVKAIAIGTAAVEVVTAVVLAARFRHAGHGDLAHALWSGVFHAVMAFNNAGLSLYEDNLVRFVGDPVVILTMGLSIVVGGLGFPVLLELTRERVPSTWSLHTRITLAATGVLVLAGPVLVTAFEWSNPRTLGPLSSAERVLAGWFQGISPRTAGFNSVDIAGMRAGTLLVVVVLMFIGSGAASTGGGIKVTTFAVVGLAVWSEVRGRGEPTVFGRRIPDAAIRQALAVVALSIGAAVSAGLALLALDAFDPFDALFEAFSAFGTVGLSTGVTSRLSTVAQIVLMATMLAGRLGPTTFASALVTRERPRLYRFPEERPIIG